MIIETQDGESVESLDTQSTFSNLSETLGKKIENWQEFYVLIGKDTKQEIDTTEIYDNIITKAKESQAMNVIFLCKPKYTFIVTNEAYEKYNETANKPSTKTDEENDEMKENSFSFSYFGVSNRPFEDFFSKIRKHFSRIEEKFDLTFNGDIIDDDTSFNRMIKDVKYKNESKIFVTSKVKVWHLFFFLMWVLL